MRLERATHGKTFRTKTVLEATCGVGVSISRGTPEFCIRLGEAEEEGFKRVYSVKLSEAELDLLVENLNSQKEWLRNYGRRGGG